MEHAKEKYTIAWFKLAEFVARGERERALGLQRLLMHSINDEAFSSQLEGDLLRAFDDISGACERYTKAAQFYRSQNRFIEAVGVYEHLLLLEPHRMHERHELIDLYIHSGSHGPAVHHAGLLIADLCVQSNPVLIHELCTLYLPLVDEIHGAFLCEHAVLALVKLEGPTEQVKALALRAAQGFVLCNRQGELGRFMAKLEAMDCGVYQYVVSSL